MSMAYLKDQIPRKSAKLIITEQVTELIRDLQYGANLFSMSVDSFKVGADEITCATMEGHVKRMHLKAYAVIAHKMGWGDLKARIDRALIS